MNSVVDLVNGLLTGTGWNWQQDLSPDGDVVMTVLPGPNGSRLRHFLWVDEASRRLEFSSQDTREVSNDLYWQSNEFVNWANVHTSVAKVTVFSSGERPPVLRMSYVINPVPQTITAAELASIHLHYVLECIAVDVEFAGVLVDGMSGAAAAAAIPGRIAELERR